MKQSEQTIEYQQIVIENDNNNNNNKIVIRKLYFKDNVVKVQKQKNEHSSAGMPEIVCIKWS